MNLNMTKKRYGFASLKSIVIMLFCLMTTFPAVAQLRTVNGTVVDASGEAIIGATVKVEGTKRGTITNIDGQFSIEATPNDRITVSYVGFLNVTVTASNTALQVVLIEDPEMLEELVVVGYGTRRKESIIGSVANITNREISITKNENVINMLTGKMPGIRIMQSSSQPGNFDTKIDIRGMGEPLIVVDGFPRGKDYFSRMDANEIESVSVLKDASAAIYGVRSANGVLLVTTKRGSSSTEGKFDITFSTNYGYQSFLYVPQTASAVDHMLLINEKNLHNFNNNYFFRKDTQYSYDQMFEYSTGEKTGTNWTEELFKEVAPQQQHNLSINGSSGKIDYFFNLGYMEQMGSYKSGSLNYERYNFRSNIDVRITNRLKATVMLSGYMDEKNEPFTDIWAVYKKAWTYRPTSEAYINGDHNFPAYDTEMLESENPVASTNSDYSGYRRDKRQNFTGALALTYNIPGVKGLEARAFYSYDYKTTNNTELKRTYLLYRRTENGDLNNFLRNDPASLRRRTDPAYGTVMQLSLNYNNKFRDHNVGGLLLFEEQYNFWDNFFAQRNMPFDSEYIFTGANDIDQIGWMDKGGLGDEARQAIVGRVNYDYKGRYLFEYSFRYDGSSRWPKESRWGFFPSVSAGWRLSEEDFMKNSVPFLNNLMLRASIGKLGDDRASSSIYPPTVVGYDLSSGSNDYRGWFYNGVLVGSFKPTAIPNPDLTWYTSTTSNIGLDFNLWNHKLTGTVDVFRRSRNGLLEKAVVVLPGTVGAEMPDENKNKDRTFGWEISLGHKNKIQEVLYWVNGQFSATKNRWIEKWASPGGNSMDEWYRRDVSGRNKDIWFAYEEGGRFQNFNEIYNHSVTGGNYGQGSLPGDYWYKDWNGDGIIDDKDKHPVATYNLPTFNFGVAMGAQWRGLDLTMNWAGSAGIYNKYDEVFTEVGPFNGGAVLDIYKDRWHTENVYDDPWNRETKWIAGYYPATGHSFNDGTTGIKNTSYIRLKTIELGYTLPKAWVNKAGVKDLRLYVNGYNVLTFSGNKYIDPERPGQEGGVNNDASKGILFYNYPVNRVLNFGAVLKF